MEKFRFKFQSVLQVRKVKEEEALRLLSIAQGFYQSEIRNKSFLISELTSAFKMRDILISKSNFGADFSIENSYITGTKHRIKLSDQSILNASRKVEKALRNYLVLKKKTHAMEILRENSYAEYRKIRSKEEQKESDDINVMRSRLKEWYF